MWLNVESSHLINIDSDILQCSVQGPLAFLTIIDDIDGAATLIKLIKKFADNTKLGQTIINDKDRDNLQECLYLICSWASRRGMRFYVKNKLDEIIQKQSILWTVKNFQSLGRNVTLV